MGVLVQKEKYILPRQVLLNLDMSSYRSDRTTVTTWPQAQKAFTCTILFFLSQRKHFGKPGNGVALFLL